MNLTPDERRRDRHARYNRSSKGQARNRRYEKKHPERAQRVRTGMIAQDALRLGAAGTARGQLPG